MLVRTSGHDPAGNLLTSSSVNIHGTMQCDGAIPDINYPGNSLGGAYLQGKLHVCGSKPNRFIFLSSSPFKPTSVSDTDPCETLDLSDPNRQWQHVHTQSTFRKGHALWAWKDTWV